MLCVTLSKKISEEMFPIPLELIENYSLVAEFFTDLIFHQI